MNEKRETEETRMTTYQESSPGVWTPAIPEPWYARFWVRCHCGKRFRNRGKYRDHYTAEHLADARPYLRHEGPV